MDRTLFFSALTVPVVAWAYVPYIRSILKDTSKPTFSTWLSWLLVNSVILAGMIAKHSVVPQMYVYITGTGIIAVLCLIKTSSKKWRKIDIFCVGLVVLAMIGWYFTGEANVAIVISVTANAIGSVPMLANLWKDPSSEPLESWRYKLLGASLGVLAIPSMTIALALQPIMFFIVTATTTCLIVHKFR